MAAAILSQSTLKSLLHYCPDTGLFTWLVSRNGYVKAGEVAGSTYNHGYLRVKIDAKRFMAHRLAWFYTYGTWPSTQLDHINRDRADNRLSNLRLATQAENMQNKALAKNNSSGYTGVGQRKNGKYLAYIRVDGERIHLGTFNTFEEAKTARIAEELKRHHFKIHD